jgi:hypothetical protein
MPWIPNSVGGRSWIDPEETSAIPARMSHSLPPRDAPPPPPPPPRPAPYGGSCSGCYEIRNGRIVDYRERDRRLL